MPEACRRDPGRRSRYGCRLRRGLASGEHAPPAAGAGPVL